MSTVNFVPRYVTLVLILATAWPKIKSWRSVQRCAVNVLNLVAIWPTKEDSVDIVLESASGSLSTENLNDLSIRECRLAFAHGLEVLDECLLQKGKYIQKDLLSSLIECLQLVNLSEKALLERYSQAVALCDLAAMACDGLREKLQRLESNLIIDQGIEALKNCADSCRQL
jgi:hypothetical protein